MQTLEKRTSEQVRFDIDCSALLSAGETITSVTSVSADANAGTALTFGAPTVNTVAVTYTDRYGSTRTAPIGQVIQVQISGGSIPAAALIQNYVIRVKFATSVNPAVEATVVLRINDTPAST